MIKPPPAGHTTPAGHDTRPKKEVVPGMENSGVFCDVQGCAHNINCPEM